MTTHIESFFKDNEEERLEGVVKTMKPYEREKYLEQEATIYLNMVDRYSPDEELMQKAE